MRFDPTGMTAQQMAEMQALNDRLYGGSAPQTAYSISDFGYEPDLPQKPDLPVAFNDPFAGTPYAGTGGPRPNIDLPMPIPAQEPTYPYNPYGSGGGRPQLPPLVSGIPGVGLLAPEGAQSGTGNVSDLGYEPDLPTDRYVSSPEIDPYTQAYTNPYSSPLTTQVSGMKGSFGTGAMPYTQPYYQRSFNPYSGGFGMGQPMRGGGYGGKGGGRPPMYGNPYGGGEEMPGGPRMMYQYGGSQAANPYSTGYGMGYQQQPNQQPNQQPMGGGKGGGMPAYSGGYGGYGGKGGRR